MNALLYGVKKIKHYVSYIPYYLFKPKLRKCSGSPKLIVSLTSYPARLRCLPIVCGSLIRQTMKPDAIVLYLSKTQFADKDNPVLASLERQGIQIKVVDDDLKSHKKYFYSMQEFSDSVIITVDDDLVQDKNTIKDLYESYLKHPTAVSAKRVHGIRFNAENHVLPYREWEYEKVDQVDTEDYALIATGGAGALYPPHIFDKSCFDSEVIKKTCLQADDLWLKVMELVNGVPVVLVDSKNYKLRNVWGTLSNGLAQNNVEKNENDVQLQNICSYLSINLFELVHGGTHRGRQIETDDWAQG